MTGAPSATTALLVLEDGRIFRGDAFGATGSGLGEAVFATGMTGYQETLTDPSYHRQIVVQTAPQIGNTGWNDEDDESGAIQVAGYAVRDPSRIASNWRSSRSLPDALREQGVVGIAGIDTRALVRHLRERGAMRAGVFSGDALAADAELLDRVRASPQMAGADLYGAVSTREPYVVPATVAKRFTVAALDVGIKSNTPRMLAARGIETHVLPADTTIEQLEELGADGFFLSNGPGDPATADGPVELTRQVLERGIPLFGICFGNQILGRALGRGTYKMRYGHRGINVPVIEHETGRVAITSQNHGFAVEGERGERFDTPFGPAVITHTCSNDGTVEGMRVLGVPAFSVQYHPEAAAGPHDAADLFDRFVDLMAQATGRGRHRLYDPPPGVEPPVTALPEPTGPALGDAGPADPVAAETAEPAEHRPGGPGPESLFLDPPAPEPPASDPFAPEPAGPEPVAGPVDPPRPPVAIPPAVTRRDDAGDTPVDLGRTGPVVAEPPAGPDRPAVPPSEPTEPSDGVWFTAGTPQDGPWDDDPPESAARDAGPADRNPAGAPLPQRLPAAGGPWNGSRPHAASEEGNR